MCCSVSPDVRVRFSDTILYAAEALHPRGEVVHVLGYQNIAQNNVSGQLSGTFQRIKAFLESAFFSAGPAGNGNAMILPFPAVPGTMTSENVLDTERCPDVLSDIRDALRQPVVDMPATASFSLQAGRAPRIQVFEAAGIYTVVLAQDARDIPEALELVPKQKRPVLNQRLFADYSEWYPDWTFALCCFNNTEAKRALPMLWWYEPMVPDELFLPTLDSHDGSSPDLGADVLLDHTLAVSTYRPDAEDGGRFISVQFNDTIPAELEPFLENRVIGRSYYEQMRNGDMVCILKAVRNGTFHPFRRPPPGVGA